MTVLSIKSVIRRPSHSADPSGRVLSIKRSHSADPECPVEEVVSAIGVVGDVVAQPGTGKAVLTINGGENRPAKIVTKLFPAGIAGHSPPWSQPVAGEAAPILRPPGRSLWAASALAEICDRNRRG